MKLDQHIFYHILMFSIYFAFKFYIHYSFLTGALIWNLIKMKKRVQLFDPTKDNPPVSILQPIKIDWDLCVLCQKIQLKKNKKQPLIHPDGRKGAGSGYETLEYKILEFYKLDALPHKLNFNLINDGSGISQTLQKIMLVGISLAICLIVM